MKSIVVFFFVALCSLSAFSQGAFGQTGISIYGGAPHAGNSDISDGVYGLSYFLPSGRLPGFHEFGLVAQPFGSIRDNNLSSRPKYESWVALTTGHMFILWPWLRPGFSIGPLYAKTAQSLDGKAFYGSEFAAYYAATLQAFLFSFTLSNLAWNIGINLSL